MSEEPRIYCDDEDVIQNYIWKQKRKEQKLPAKPIGISCRFIDTSSCSMVTVLLDEVILVNDDPEIIRNLQKAITQSLANILNEYTEKSGQAGL